MDAGILRCQFSHPDGETGHRHHTRKAPVWEPLFCMVPMAGLEPAQRELLPPQDSVSTNSTTSAIFRSQQASLLLRILVDAFFHRKRWQTVITFLIFRRVIQ